MKVHFILSRKIKLDRVSLGTIRERCISHGALGTHSLHSRNK